MERCLIQWLSERIGSTEVICGKVGSLRDHGKMAFIDLYDRSGSVQCFIGSGCADFGSVRDISPESVLSLRGTVKERPEKNRTEGENGGIEFSVEGIVIVSRAQELPFEIESDLNIDTKFDYRPLTLRRSEERALFTVQSHILQMFREYLLSQEFVEFRAPSIVGSDAEGGAEVFSVKYFEQDASLATSPQLYKQIAVGGFERVFCIGNVFRAEKHSTSRHLNEYTSLDFEMGYIDDHRDVMAVLEGCMRHCTEQLSERCGKEFAVLSGVLPLLPKDAFPAVKLLEAQNILREECDIDCGDEPDLNPEHERLLCEWALKHHNSDFMFVTHYPSAKRPMYAYDDPDDPGYTKSFDLLFRGVEIVSGGQRMHSYDALVAKMQKTLPGVAVEEVFSFYLQAFKYGMPPHGGVGMGLERLTAKMVGLANVKEAAMFPRDRNRIDTRLSE